MKNIVLGLDAGTVAERNEITNFFANNNWAYWHWIDDLWIVQVPNDYTPKKLYNLLEEKTNIKEKTTLVFELKGEMSYWGRNNDEAWKWLSVIGKPE